MTYFTVYTYEYYEEKCSEVSGCNRGTDYKDGFLLRRDAV